ncbi:MAG: hypothetical protein WAM54_03565 [Nitrososphaeraceae archaeon]
MDSVIIVGILRAYIVINICSKQDFGENSNWQYIPDTIKRYIQMQGAENSLVKAKELGWTIVSMKNDWNTVFQPTNTNSKIEN